MVPRVSEGEIDLVRAAILVAAAAIGLGSFPALAEIKLDTVNTVPCAEEGGVCKMPYPTNVYFGVPGKTNGRPFQQGGSVPCNVQSFGDPAPNQRKTCWYAPRLTESGGVGRYRNDDRGRDDGRYRRDDRDDDRSRDVYRSRDGYRDEDRPRRDDDRNYDRPRRSYDDDGAVRRRYRTVPDDE